MIHNLKKIPFTQVSRVIPKKRAYQTLDENTNILSYSDQINQLTFGDTTNV